jgi:hypothetical protein
LEFISPAYDTPSTMEKGELEDIQCPRAPLGIETADPEKEDTPSGRNQPFSDSSSTEDNNQDVNVDVEAEPNSHHLQQINTKASTITKKRGYLFMVSIILAQFVQLIPYGAGINGKTYARHLSLLILTPCRSLYHRTTSRSV